ncbi:LD-carboxypeptidase [Arcticibacter sp. MXS-1]|uniref:S66 peptidase family protein n=1 Tax=Arcticibacter sp. MXS-1 TaxID=3341726 RepID=UPI0035A83088
MNRKSFLSALVPLGLTLGSFAAGVKTRTPSAKPSLAIPPYLQPGDTIGLTSPAGYISEEDVRPAVQQMESWGFKILIGKTIGCRSFSMGGTDEERARDLQDLLDNREVRAIMCARGGYGALRIIDQLDFSRFVRYPKWIIGFSDITVIHCHLNSSFHVATLHSKMCNSFPSDWNKAEPIQITTIHSIRDALMGLEMRYEAPSHGFNRAGKAKGVLVGGNLRTIENLAGSRSDLRTDGKILFVEDTGEYLYSIDRMFWNLKRSGKLANLKGLIIGGFKIKPDDPGEEFGKSLYEIVQEKTREYTYPVCFDFPVGHQKNNFALKCGVQHFLEVQPTGATLRSL